jgi:hypothetical protein
MLTLSKSRTERLKIQMVSVLGRRLFRLFALPLLAVGALLIAGGCTHSSLCVESDPDGAEVFFDGKPKGVTPVEFDFKWYGGHKIKLRKEGYRDYNEIVRLKAPPHYQVPVDLFTELIPAEIADRQKRSYTLQPLAPLPAEPSVP